MNLRHAAALALVGWYILAPPPALFHEVERGSRAHIRLWRRKGNQYASATACERALKKLKAQIERQKEGNSWNAAEMDANLSSTTMNGYQGVLLAECIATDDPRLKSN